MDGSGTTSYTQTINDPTFCPPAVVTVFCLGSKATTRSSMSWQPEGISGFSGRTLLVPVLDVVFGGFMGHGSWYTKKH